MHAVHASNVDLEFAMSHDIEHIASLAAPVTLRPAQACSDVDLHFNCTDGGGRPGDSIATFAACCVGTLTDCLRLIHTLCFESVQASLPALYAQEAAYHWLRLPPRRLVTRPAT